MRNQKDIIFKLIQHESWEDAYDYPTKFKNYASMTFRPKLQKQNTKTASTDRLERPEPQQKNIDLSKLVYKDPKTRFKHSFEQTAQFSNRSLFKFKFPNIKETIINSQIMNTTPTNTHTIYSMKPFKKNFKQTQHQFRKVPLQTETKLRAKQTDTFFKQHNHKFKQEKPIQTSPTQIIFQKVVQNTQNQLINDNELLITKMDNKNVKTHYPILEQDFQNKFVPPPSQKSESVFRFKPNPPKKLITRQKSTKEIDNIEIWDQNSQRPQQDDDLQQYMINMQIKN